MTANARPFFSYYGGKWRDARRYPSPAHKTIVEPFAGSAGYSVRHHAHDVILVDSDEAIAGVWEFLIGVSPSEVLAIPDVPPDGVRSMGLCQEAEWLVGFWVNKGAATPRNKPSAWMRSGRYNNSFWGERVRQTIASQVELIRHWRVVHGSWQRLDVSEDATWYVDPPYMDQGRHYRHGAGGIDYRALGDWCRALPGQVIVCEQEGADWLPFERLHEAKTPRKSKRSAEVIWTNDSPRPDRQMSIPLDTI